MLGIDASLDTALSLSTWKPDPSLPVSVKKIEESAELFQNNLQPLFSMISETSKTHILDKLSNSLKKALILMAIDRYKSDRDSICKALGISQEKLEKEMMVCGLKQR